MLLLNVGIMDEESEDGHGNSVGETCFICGQECLDETEMNVHMASHREDLVCLFCDFVANDSDQMTDHINQIHPNDISDKTDVGKVQDKMTCLFCDFMTSSSDEMNIHINVIHLNDSPCNAKDKPVVRTSKDNRNIQGKDKIPANSYTQTVLEVNGGFLEVEKYHKKPKLDNRIKIESSNALSCHKLASAESSISGTSSHFGIHSEENSRVDTNSKPLISSSKCSSDLDEYPRTHVCNSNGDNDFKKTTTDFVALSSLPAECYICPFCEFVTDNEQAYERHLSEEQSVSEAPMVCEDTCPAEDSASSSSLQCPVCGMSFVHREPYEHHVHQHFGEDLSTGESFFLLLSCLKLCCDT